ncbi:hypothetical protein SAMN05443637_11323 [Pseudonocardia thermophila]|jgi:hypothetical protein|uniref:Uncharacterized protein n=1 Tax=Pseudonocardia thermophila TaxID=1848 RepID=A0A1M6VS14_PSETH|nr:hypothetical protein [Pseudonocardia thermophila]SHK84302.1 hypothetical protein SAMN05443637_11323 [Pseudonocardia thermophila]
MSRPDDDRIDGDQTGGDRTDPPSWAGAPGYHPADEPAPEPDPAPPRPGYQRVPEGLAPHAPMPGAPPYPAAPPPDLAPGPRPGAGFPKMLAATAVWWVAGLVLSLALARSPAEVAVFTGLAITAAVALWLALRRRAARFWQLVLGAAPLAVLAWLVSGVLP